MATTVYERAIGVTVVVSEGYYCGSKVTTPDHACFLVKIFAHALYNEQVDLLPYYLIATYSPYTCGVISRFFMWIHNSGSYFLNMCSCILFSFLTMAVDWKKWKEHYTEIPLF